MLLQALELDPEYVPAWNELSITRFRLAQDETYSWEEGLRLSNVALERALAIDPDDALANANRAWNLVEWEAELEIAAELYLSALRNDPGNAEVLFLAGKFARWIGRHDDALTLYNRAILLDPLCFNCLYHLSKIYMETGRLEEAEIARRKWMESVPGPGGEYHYGLMFLLKEDPEAALGVFDGLPDEFPSRDAGRAMALRDLGRQAEANAALAQLIANADEDSYQMVAQVYAWTGEIDAAFEWLERAFGPDMGYFFHTIHNPIWQNLRSDPRWKEMRKRAGFSEKRLAAIEFKVVLPE